ncbi:MAG: exodeoxyribonuclease VII large subunit [Oscillospiraceae bacterium]
MLTLTVSQLNRYVKALLEEDDKLRDVYIKAEVSNFTNHFSSGHFYFTLKDDGAAVRSVMFRRYAEELRFEPENGMAVLARASVGVYERDGVYQLYVTDLQPDGAGAMSVAVRQLRERLEREGLFEVRHKKSLPPFPKTVGVITSETGAAIGDITKVLERRFPLAKLLFAPALVQGKEAPPSLIDALDRLDGRCDVIIIGRGGGSSEDLWAFQDERLARRIFMARTPIISAVGHEMDVTICDMVADLRAPTPSAAAELAVPDVVSIGRELDERAIQLSEVFQKRIDRASERLSVLEKQTMLLRPDLLLDKKRERLDFLSKTLYTTKKVSFDKNEAKLLEKQQKIAAKWQHYMQEQEHRVREKAALLEGLSPFGVLSRGYAAAFREGKPLRSARDVAAGDELTLRLQDGELLSRVEKVVLFEDRDSEDA